MFRSKSGDPQVDKQQLEQEEREKQGVYKTLKSIYKTAKEIKIVGVDTFSRLAKDLEHVGALLESVSDKLTKMIESDDEDKNDLRDIVACARNLNARAQELFKLMSQGQASISDKLTAVDLLLKEVPTFIQSIEYLNLGESTHHLPKSLAEIKERALAAFRGMVEDVFPAFITEQMKKLKTSALGTDKSDIEIFKKMDHAEQVVTLAALHKMNVLMRKLVLRADEIEIRYTMHQGSIFNMIQFGVDFSDNEALSHLSVPEKSVNEWFSVISDAYALRLEAFGHEKREEVYPYTQAVLAARKVNLDEMRNEQNKVKTEQDILDLAAKRWSKAEGDVNSAIAEAKAANEKSTITTIKKDRLARIKFLGEFAEVLKQNQGGSMHFMEEFRKKKGIQPHESLTVCFKAIEKVLNRVDAVRKHLLEKRDKEISRLDKCIARLEELNNASDEVATNYVDFAEDDAALFSGIEKLATITLRDMTSFMQAARMHASVDPVKPESDENNVVPTNIEGLIRHLADVKKTFENVLDVDTFKRVFAENHSAMTAPVSWVENIGRGYRALEHAIETLRKLQDRYENANENSKKVSPQLSMKEFADLALEFNQAMGQLAWSMEGLISNPAIKAAALQVENWRETFDRYKQIVESDPWYVFALGEGQDSAKRLFGVDRVQDLLTDVSRFYEYAGAKFGHDVATREKVTTGLAGIRWLTIESNKLKYDAKTSSVIGFVFRNRSEILSVLPSISQIKHSITDVSVEQGLEMLARVNQMLKKLYLFADEIETTFHLRKGYITSELLSFGEGADKKSLQSYALEFQQALYEAGYTFPPEDVFPYASSIQAARHQQYETTAKKLERLKAEEERLLLQRDNIEAALSNGVDGCLDKLKWHQVQIDLLIDRMIAALKLTNGLVGKMAIEYADLSVENDGENIVNLDLVQEREKAHDKIVDRVKLQTSVILPRLERELIFLKARLKEADASEKKNIQKRIDIIKSECDKARAQIKELPASVRHSVKDKKKANSDNPGNGAEAKRVNHEINVQINELKKAKLEYKKKSDIVEMGKLSGHKARLQRIKVLKEEQARVSGVDHREAIARLEGDEHRYIALQAAVSADSPAYKKIISSLYENEVAQLNLVTASTLLKSRIDGENVKVVEDNSAKLAEAKRFAVNYLNAEIEKLRREKFAAPLLFRKNKLGVKLKKLDVLTYLRDQYMRPGFTFEDAQTKLKAKSGDLYNFGLSHYRSMYEKVKAIDKAPGFLRGHRVVGDEPVNMQPAAPALNDLIDMVESRKKELTAELSNRVVFTSTKKKKIILLDELNTSMKTMSYAAAMESVRAKHADTYYLLFEGRTGKLIKNIEIGSYAKADIQKMITVEIDRLKLAKDKPYTFFAAARRKTLQSRIDALQKLMDEGFDVSKLDKKEIGLLKKHEKNLLADCAMFVAHEVRRMAPVK